MKIKQRLVSENKYNLKCPYFMTPKGICVHNTSNDASAENEMAYMIGNDLATSFHYAIDDKEVIQGIPETRNAFHAGDGASGEGNRKHIGIEICYSRSGGERFIQAEKNAAVFIADKLREYGWNISHVKKHQDFSGKYCPHRTLDMGWQRFLDMIQAELDKLGKEDMKMLNPYEGGKFRVTSIYGNRNIGSGNEFHKGLDLVGESSKKLLAVCDGIVQQSRMIPKSTGDLTWQWGNYICIKADTGELIYYCHLSERLVSKGQRVKKGDAIGIEGSTGYSFGSHCHLEVRTGGNVTTSTVNTPAFTGIPNKIGKYVIEEEEEMTKEEIQKLVAEEVSKAMNASKEKVYHYWEELPEWAHDPIKALYDKKYFFGNNPGDLDLPYGTMRTLVVLARAMKEDGKIVY